MAIQPQPQASDAGAQLPANLTDPAALQAMLYKGAPVELSGGNTPPVVTKEPTPPPAEPAAPQVTQTEPPTSGNPPAGIQPPPGTQEEPLEGRILPNRISTAQFEPEAQRAMSMQYALNNGRKHGDPGFVTLADALQRVRTADNPPAPTPAAPEPPQPSQFEVLTTSLADAETRLAELLANKNELLQGGRLSDEDTAALDRQILEAQRDASRLETRMEFAKRDEEAMQAQRAASEREATIKARSSVMDRVIQQYPTANDNDSPLGKEVTTLVAELKQPGNKDRSILSAENAAEIITERAATRLARKMASEQGIKFADALDSLMAPADQTPPESQQTPPRILPGVGKQAPTVTLARKTGAEVLADVGTDPAKARAALYGTQQGTTWMIRG